MGKLLPTRSTDTVPMTLGTVLINVVIPLNGTIKIEYQDERHFERLRMDFRINELDPRSLLRWPSVLRNSPLNGPANLTAYVQVQFSLPP